MNQRPKIIKTESFRRHSKPFLGMLVNDKVDVCSFALTYFFAPSQKTHTSPTHPLSSPNPNTPSFSSPTPTHPNPLPPRHTLIQIVVVPVQRGEGAMVHVAKTVSAFGTSCLCAARDDLEAVDTSEEEKGTMKNR